MDFFFGVLTKREFDQANRDLFFVVAVELGVLLVVVYGARKLWRFIKQHSINQKLKEQEFLDQRKIIVSELDRLGGIGELYTDFLAGGSKWSEKYENSALRMASFNEIRAGLLLDVRKTLDRDLTLNNRRKLLKGLRDVWGTIPFFGILKNCGTRSEMKDSMPVIDAQNILEAFIAVCEPSLKFGGPDWEAVYQKIVVPMLHPKKQG